MRPAHIPKKSCPGFDPGICWIAGSSPAMTVGCESYAFADASAGAFAAAGWI